MLQYSTPAKMCRMCRITMNSFHCFVLVCNHELRVEISLRVQLYVPEYNCSYSDNNQIRNMLIHTEKSFPGQKTCRNVSNQCNVKLIIIERSLQPKISLSANGENPFMPTGAFNMCCPRDCVSRHNGGTSGAPLKPLRVDSALIIIIP